MSTSRIDAVLDVLVTTFGTALVGQATLVYDGPQASDEHAGRMLFVGGDGGEDLDEPVSTTQEWAHANYTTKDEFGTVDCVLYSQDGTTEVSRLRTEGQTLIGLCENALRADPTLGNVVLYSDISALKLDQQQTEQGALARYIFTVRYRARI